MRIQIEIGCDYLAFHESLHKSIVDGTEVASVLDDFVPQLLFRSLKAGDKLFAQDKNGNTVARLVVLPLSGRGFMDEIDEQDSANAVSAY